MELFYRAENDVHAFSYKYTESERIWMKSAAL